MEQPTIAQAGDQPLPEEIVGSTDPLVSSEPDTLPWGVVGFGTWSHVSTNLRVPVFAIQHIGDRTFVGGMFASVQDGSGGPILAQPFLAAFDRLSGEWISDWQPAVDASVYALGATADGKLIVGGDFTNIDGVANTTALAALDPLTGSVITGWRATLERPYSSNEPVVRAIDVLDGWVYAAGNFSHVDTLASRTRVYKTVKVRESDGVLDVNWRPQITGAGAWAIGVAPDSSRVTFGGFFSAVNGSPDTAWIGVVDNVTGASIPGLIYEKTHPSSGHIQAVADTGSKLYYSGSQHFLFQHDTTTWVREEGTTYRWGGDGQAIEIVDGIIYNACHCALQNAYTDSYTWPDPSPGSVRHELNGIAAHTQSGFDYQDSFQPAVYYENGDGPWTLSMDVSGCLWVGGDVFRLNDDLPYRWARGFTRLCQDDHEAPTAPGGLSVNMGGVNLDVAQLSWLPSSDNRGVDHYEVYRDGVLIGTTGTTSYADPGVVQATIYRVRAVDARGNKSATSEPVTASPPSPGAVLIAAGSTWNYLDDGSNPGTAWRGLGYDDSGWATGPAELGFGDGDEATVTSGGIIETYFRNSFTVADPTATSLSLELLADDGAVVYLNGVELVRDNIGPGPLGWPTWPLGWKGEPEESAFETFDVSAAALVAGDNVVAVSVHNASSNNSDLSFDLRLTKGSATVVETELLGAGSTWRYLDDGSNQGTAWKEIAFDDSSWAAGAGRLGYGNNPVTTIAEGNPRYVTAYFRTSFNVADPAAFASLDLALLVDDGAVVWINGVEVARDGMTAGAVAYDTLATDYIWGPAETTYDVVSIPSSALTIGANVIAVEVHSADTGSADLGFDASLDGVLP